MYYAQQTGCYREVTHCQGNLVLRNDLVIPINFPLKIAPLEQIGRALTGSTVSSLFDTYSCLV